MAQWPNTGLPGAFGAHRRESGRPESAQSTTIWSGVQSYRLTGPPPRLTMFKFLRVNRSVLDHALGNPSLFPDKGHPEKSLGSVFLISSPFSFSDSLQIRVRFGR